MRPDCFRSFYQAIAATAIPELDYPDVSANPVFIAGLRLGSGPAIQRGAEMAVRLEDGLGGGAGAWLRMRMNYDLAKIRHGRSKPLIDTCNVTYYIKLSGLP
jgi:hypothetical protein